MKLFLVILRKLQRFGPMLLDMLWEVFAANADARNELLTEWKALGGRDIFIESFWNIIDAINAVVTPIKEAFSQIFPPMTAERLVALTGGS